MMFSRVLIAALAASLAGVFAGFGDASGSTISTGSRTNAQQSLDISTQASDASGAGAFLPSLTASAQAAVVSVIDAVADMANKLPNEAWQGRLAHGFSPNANWRELPLVGIDLEFIREGGQVYPSQIGIVRVEDGVLTDQQLFRITSRSGKLNFKAEEERLIDPRKIKAWLEDPDNTSFADSPAFEHYAERFRQITEGAIPVAYGARWDKVGLAQEWAAMPRGGKPPNILRDHVTWLDTYELLWATSRSDAGNTLSDSHLRLKGKTLDGAHTSTIDAGGALKVLFELGEIEGFPQRYGDAVRYLVAIEQNRAELGQLSKQRLAKSARLEDSGSTAPRRRVKKKRAQN